ncbi:hypothetical protein [Desulforhabdus amnigena]|jgi:hypothetical protein|uniref:Uncharacterized protein n=1 Tax=Desulforhabdus amnigena TaxID=40218 RepID=A0A9W6D301_9BACT|nr:hypothetical protein [Desulforhabdus amnigena]NLJ28626.1 hypothetical protein [Deltaproteobacteria bacterium]GLI33250.1 hypothetical protein DAMNIGENAA_06830 [Desulforhabdus amnigena]
MNMNYSQKIAVALLDVALIIELCVSIYFANKDTEMFTILFMKYFFSMLIPTLIFARIAVKRLRLKETELNA